MEKKFSFNSSSLVSPIRQQPFIWAVEYTDGLGLTEFDEDKSENLFKDIDKTKMFKFGLIGNHNKLLFEIEGGNFYIKNIKYNIYLQKDNIKYNLINRDEKISDIITYKQATASLNSVMNGSKEHQLQSIITGYYFGYKFKHEFNGINFNFKPIICIENQKPLFMKIAILADDDFDGEIVFVKNNVEKFTYPISLKKNNTNNSVWNIR